MSLRTPYQLAAFGVAGGLAAVANIGSRIVFNRWMPYTAAIILAYIVGMIVAFVLNRLFVFRETVNPLHYQAFWFTVVNLAAVLQTLAVSLLLADYVFPHAGLRWYPETVAHAIGVGIPVITSFIGHKKLSFRET